VANTGSGNRAEISTNAAVDAMIQTIAKRDRVRYQTLQRAIHFLEMGDEPKGMKILYDLVEDFLGLTPA
jgi:hypothetical protein